MSLTHPTTRAHIFTLSSGCNGKLYECKGCSKKFCAQSKGCGHAKYSGNGCKGGCGASKVKAV